MCPSAYADHDEDFFVTCENCGNEQPDFGANVACEQCGETMPYYDEDGNLID